ncbi:ATP-binding response regulator [Aliiglaciecola litoralis]|uniref:histidine kinase n=1 Tax=Aliiglaciecola litoralis TaxID=582857 RepID=A0ABN1LR19_9ALTE
MEVKSARILFVEDDEDDYILTVEQLEKLDNYHFEIDWVTTRDEALHKLQCNEHDICLLDHQLGAYTGLDVLHQANELGSHVPIIMLTGQPDEELDKLALDGGAADFLSKGEISDARFARAIRYAISRVEVQKARQQSIDAQTESRSKDRFIAHLSHELRTPLTSILGYAELLINSDKANQAHEELSAILNNGNHLLSLLNDILDLSKIAAGKLQLKSESVMFSSFIGDILTLMYVPAASKGLALHCECINRIPKNIITDPTRLRQVIINLMYNAIKFTQKGSVTLKIEYDQITSPELLKISVSDTGVGIPKKDLDSIFTPFQQLEKVAMKGEAGSGLGLAISNELIRRMDGEISVESEVNKGSTFTVILPLAPSCRSDLESLEIGISDIQPKQEYAPLQGSVLVVDDLKDIRQLVGGMCRSYGLNVSYAKNGQQAVTIIESGEHNIDLVIMDIHMPVMDGKQAIVNIRKQGFAKPIFALTAARMKGSDKELKQLGFNNVISKPVRQTELYDQLADSLARQKQENNNHSYHVPERLSNHVLIVEDDKDAAELIVLLLQSLKINAEAVLNYQSGLQKLSNNNNYTHVFVDKNLPDGDGLELIKQIEALCPDPIDISLVSGEEVDSDTAAKYGINRSLLKPINLEQLRSIFSSTKHKEI